MSPSLRSLLVGSADGTPSGRTIPPLVGAVFVSVFAAYAAGVFRVSGGVVWLAGEAAAVGVLAAGWLAYRGYGMAFAWVIVYAALLGFNADHYLLGLSGRSLAERTIAFLGPDGLAVVGIQAIVLGTLAWIVGAVAVRAVETIGAHRAASDGGR